MVKLLDLLCDASAAHETILLIVLLEGCSLVVFILRLVVHRMGLGGSALVCSVTVRLYLEGGRLLLLGHARADDVGLAGDYRSCRVRCVQRLDHHPVARMLLSTGDYTDIRSVFRSTTQVHSLTGDHSNCSICTSGHSRVLHR